MPLSQIQLDVIALIKRATNVLVLPSSPIDGDSIGSALALYLALQKLGKKVTVVAEERVPESYAFLPQIKAISHELSFIRDFIVTIDCREAPPENVKHEIQGNKVNVIVRPQKGAISKEQVSFAQGPAPFDCVISVDAADPSQFGKIYENSTELFHLAPVINIDHHASNTGFGRINWVDIMAPSTTTMILPLIEELGGGGQNLLDADIATLLLAGLITDTGSFQNPNTTPDAFAIAAKLIGYGARQQEIIRNIYKTKKLSTLRLWGRTLTKIQYDEKHKLVWSVLTVRDFTEIGGSPDETEGVIDELMSNAPGAEIIFLIKEKSPTEVSGSIRTVTPTIDASKLAEFFGGGGHVQAAGFKMSGTSIQKAETTVVEKLRAFQKERLRLPEAAAQVPAPVVSQPTTLTPKPVAPPAVPPQLPSVPQPPVPLVPAPPRPVQPSAPAPMPSPVTLPAMPKAPVPLVTPATPVVPTPLMPPAPQAPTPPVPSAPSFSQTPPVPLAPQPLESPQIGNTFPTPPGVVG